MNTGWLREFVVLADTAYIGCDELVVLLPPRHRLAGEPMVRLEQLRDEAFACLEEESLIHELTLAACERAGFAPRVAFTCREAASIKELIRGGLGLAILTQAQAAPADGLVIRPIRPSAATRISLCYKPASDLSPAARAFLEYAAAGAR